MSQETIETATNEEILGMEPVESEPVVEETPAPDEPTAKADNRVPLDDLISERQARQRLEQELHALRIATLQGAAQPQPSQDDVVDAAIARIAKKAGWDDTVSAVLGPAMRPIIEELAYLRQINDQAMAEIGNQRAQIAHLSEREQAQAQNQELSRIIPDLDKVGPKMLELLKGMPPEVQNQYAANPKLLIPLAQAVRSSNGMEPAKPRVNKAQLSVDTGGAPSQPLSFNADSIAAMKPNSKEFEAARRAFYGEE